MFQYDVSKSNMWREVHEQPEIMKKMMEINTPVVKELCEAVKAKGFKKVVLVGRGSSEHALIAGKYAFEIYTPFLASMSSPSVITRYDGKVDLSDALVIGVSQCGEAKDVYTVLKKCQDEGGIAVSVTNERECLMRQVGNYYINCECGKETSFTAAKSYMAQTLIVLMIVAYLSGDEKLIEALNQAPDLIAACLGEEVEKQIKNTIPLFRNTKDILLLARGFGFAVAQETELKIMEASYTNAKAYSACDYPHGPIATTNRFMPVIFFLTDEKTDESTIGLVKKIQNDFKVSTLVVTNKEKYRELGNASVVLPEKAEGVSGIFGLAVFSQLFACLLSIARGYNPDEPIGLSKTTVTF
ncbi:SIS domain-containing protein [Anaerosacchariphilus sp. NSJ-68]|mgnify:CR=1 FL=1|uniref:SIS domain-containing protein n=2 Tax=Lachnospiraceae TaxID=186803 RepID=A0A923LA20_9FIRM|nr:MULTISPECIES: SIS domain-containing protein [Lachnospiraceae]MBC5658576.1 SIS domain-containing protein [Anaerosacchariphilus hominis]MBC5698215.1 SIS domain-containing protein [Roseburia difficilis]